MALDQQSPIAVIRFFIIAVCVVIFLFIGCSPPTPKFLPGQIVKSKLSGMDGQVVRAYCVFFPVCEYEVRFNIPQSQSHSHLLGPDGPITTQPFSLIWMREFELKAK